MDTINKRDHLKWIEENFGPQYVLEYFVCYNLEQIKEAIKYFEVQKKPWAVRTDTTGSFFQKDSSPFCKENPLEVFNIWEEYGTNLYYIVCATQPKDLICQAIAFYIDSEHIVIEFNDIDPNSTTIRDMDKKPYDQLKRIGVGPNTMILHPLYPTLFLRSFRPEQVTKWSFDRIYYLMMDQLLLGNSVNRIEFTVKSGGGIIIW
ncbi:TPA: hypothetical protein DCX66_03605 [Candidatus Nomurabacteria bacterium]|uniref:Uncharacterized protein n=1 Tax=Candidatus Nomurabacteria bacterium GW2011_GWE1_35_16 TaxID=1618761 RepID=A0A0G0BBT6_9BACT|nr:MAG: hypothetical protein UR55_C0001G0027 [Candidatus Nomurabacteria bacterium GW2011_GWF1_34_20]KKP63736.1 MAG: hypothetical protein UR57_C0001G0027 [Candidatus Nomurabacteria bacterium GW2011_GWE2_34_25]KKP66948.1 MAG: hypothetical protein UR64_C0001G0027 [Candidatus Nomurabacteria bacterium GW2011_GWE1_35_16]HAE36772.1 hypothetical protein [Candidatus Nomurabacteria bacterium]HAX65525.1 hypothetical protein [Candidatus Nomurabacteria bacterium]